MVVEEDGFATRATTSCTSSARRLGGSAEMIQKFGKAVVFYRFMLTIGMSPTTGNNKNKEASRFEVTKKCAFGSIVVNIL